MKQYTHGGDVETFAAQCGCRVDEVIDLSSNINFVTPHIDLDFNTLPIAAYPRYESLYADIASHYGVEVDAMELFNGGSAAIFAFFRSFRENGGQLPTLHPSKPHRCTIYSPAYLEYKRAAMLFGYDLHLIDRLSDLAAEVPEGSLVIFVNPATPDGAWYDLEPFLADWHARRCTVLIDESFIEFTPHPSATRYLPTYPNLYILKSMTKFFGAAGIRIGALLSRADNLQALKAHEPLWKLSTFDAAYIQAALRDTSFPQRSAEANARSKAYLIDLLTHHPLIETIYPSEANYLLVKLNGITADELQHTLRPHRILIRSCENFDGLDAHHVRLAVKSLDDLRALQKALDA